MRTSLRKTESAFLLVAAFAVAISAATVLIPLDLWHALAVTLVASMLVIVLCYGLLRTRDPLEGINWLNLYFLTGGVIGSLSLIFVHEYRYHGMRPGTEADVIALVRALGVSLIGLAVAYVAYERPSGRLVRSLPRPGPHWNMNRLKLAIMFFFGAAAVSAIMLAPLLARVQQGTLPRGQLVAGSNAIYFVFVLLYWHGLYLWFTYNLIKSKQREPGRLWRWSGFAIAAAGGLVLGYYSGSTGAIFYPVVLFAAIYHYVGRPISKSTLVVGALLLAVMIVGVYPTVAAELAGESAPEETGWGAIVTEMRTSRTFDGTEDLALVLEAVPEQIDHQYGLTFAAILTEFGIGDIPESRDIVMPVIFPDAYARGYGVPVTYMGELILNFGVIGLVLGMWIMGRFLRVCTDWQRANAGNPGVALIYLLLVFPMLEFIGGTFSSGTVKILAQLVPMIGVVCWVGGLRIRASRHRPAALRGTS